MSDLMLSAAMEVAPDGPTQTAIARVRGQMEDAGESAKKVTLALAQIVVDGLQHGNWPS
jgi:hypothetical protein